MGEWKGLINYQITYLYIFSSIFCNSPVYVFYFIFLIFLVIEMKIQCYFKKKNIIPYWKTLNFEVTHFSSSNWKENTELLKKYITLLRNIGILLFSIFWITERKIQRYFKKKKISNIMTKHWIPRLYIISFYSIWNENDIA